MRASHSSHQMIRYDVGQALYRRCSVCDLTDAFPGIVAPCAGKRVLKAVPKMRWEHCFELAEEKKETPREPFHEASPGYGANHDPDRSNQPRRIDL